MANEKPFEVGDIPAYEEWMDIPSSWRVLGKKNVQTKAGKPAMVVFFENSGQELQVFDWALRREPGKQFQILKRIYAQIGTNPARG